MRWAYLDPLDPDEFAYRARMLRCIDNWWTAFSDRHDDLDELFRGHAQWDLATWMEEHLHAIHPSLMWEFGPATRVEGRRLVITPESESWLRPLVKSMLQRAPKLPGWEFHEYRPAESLEDALLSVEGRTGGDLTDCQVQVRLTPTKKIELVFYPKNCRRDDDEQSRMAAFVAAESLLGEHTLDRWVGPIEVAAPSKQKKWWSVLPGKNPTQEQAGMIALERLKPTVDALIGAIIDQLPGQPCHAFINADDCDWTVFEFEPPECEDYPARDDLMIAISGRQDVLEATYAGVFHSDCHSSQGETFCYLKIDGAEGLGDSTFEDRAQVEDALNSVLVPEKVGCVFGGGTGRRYSYVDLALTDVTRALPLIRGVLLEGGVPRRTWIQFFDDAHSREWIAIHNDAPAPPR